MPFSTKVYAKEVFFLRQKAPQISTVPKSDAKGPVLDVFAYSNAYLSKGMSSLQLECDCHMGWQSQICKKGEGLRSLFHHNMASAPKAAGQEWVMAPPS